MSKENKFLIALKKVVEVDDLKNFFETLKSQNKAKEWDINPINISFKDGKVVHNAEQIKELVEVILSTSNDTLEDCKDMNTIDSLTFHQKLIYNWFIGTRKQLTEPFDKLKKEFTENEKLLKELDTKIKSKKDELLEKVYQKARIEIFKVLQNLSDEVIKEYAIEINLSIFEEFVNEKKKLKSMVLNTKENLGATNIKMITEKFNMVANPLIEAKQLQELKNKEQRLLSKELNKVVTSGENEDLKASLIDLRIIEDEISTYYSNIDNTAKSQIVNIVRIVENAIINNNKLSEIMQKTEVPKTEVEEKTEVSKTEVSEVAHGQKVKLKSFKLSEKDSKFLSDIVTSAKSEEEAKDLIMQSLANHLYMINLEEIK